LVQKDRLKELEVLIVVQNKVARYL
jgi:hypothetical protein